MGIRISDINDANVENRSGQYEGLRAAPLFPAYRPPFRRINKRLDCVDQTEDYDMREFFTQCGWRPFQREWTGNSEVDGRSLSRWSRDKRG